MIADTFNDRPKAQKSWHVVEINAEFGRDRWMWGPCDDWVQEGHFHAFAVERIGCTVTKFTVIIEVDGHCYAMREDDGERKMRMNLDSPDITT